MSSFFEPIPPPEPDDREPTPSNWAPPLWDRPSEGTVPTVVGFSRLFGRTDEVALALDHLRVYPNGLQLVVTTFVSPHLPRDLMRGAAISTVMLRAGSGRPEPDAVAEPGSPRAVRGPVMPPRVGVEFSDGRSAGQSVAQGVGVTLDEAGIPVDPVIMMGGGGGGGGQFRWEYWVFPLPPPGPLAVFAEWTSAQIPEASIVIRGEEIRDAAARASVLWT